MKIALAAIALALAAFPDASQAPSAEAQLAAVTGYLQGRAATMQESATAADVDKALAFCLPTVEYQHPRVGIKMEGADALRAGMVRFLGASRKATLQVTGTLQGRDMVAVQTHVTFEGRDGDAWKPVERSQMWVFELSDTKIKRILEYW